MPVRAFPFFIVAQGGTDLSVYIMRHCCGSASVFHKCIENTFYLLINGGIGGTFLNRIEWRKIQNSYTGEGAVSKQFFQKNKGHIG